MLLQSEVDAVTGCYLPAGVKIAMILASCFSGGWLSVDSSIMAAVSSTCESDLPTLRFKLSQGSSVYTNARGHTAGRGSRPGGILAPATL